MSFPWALFDGASKGDWICGGGALLYLSSSHLFKIKMGLGRSSNNYDNFFALNLLLLYVVERDCWAILIFEDSMKVINWASGAQNCHIFFYFLY